MIIKGIVNNHSDFEGESWKNQAKVRIEKQIQNSWKYGKMKNNENIKESVKRKIKGIIKRNIKRNNKWNSKWNSEWNKKWNNKEPRRT